MVRDRALARLLPRVQRPAPLRERQRAASAGSERAVASLHTCVTTGHGVLEQPALPIAVAALNFASVGVLLPTAESASGSVGIRNRLRHQPIRAVGELIDAPQLFRSAGEGGKRHQFGVAGRRERAVRAGNGDLEIRRAGIAAGIGDRA